MPPTDHPDLAALFMREFEDENGRTWAAGVRARPGQDFKGRFYFVASPRGTDGSDEVWLEDVRWNSVETAQRTLETMSAVELRRRLRAAKGRGPTQR